MRTRLFSPVPRLFSPVHPVLPRLYSPVPRLFSPVLPRLFSPVQRLFSPVHPVLPRLFSPVPRLFSPVHLLFSPVRPVLPRLFSPVHLLFSPVHPVLPRLFSPVLLLLLLASCSGAADPQEAGDVTIEVLHRPFICHRRSKPGDLLLVHQEGYFQNGSMFHSSRIHGDKHPVWFTLGVREVILGWDRGLKDMCAGERRRLLVPPALAFGPEGKGKIPPDSTLTFVVEVLQIRNGPRSHEAFQEMDLNDDWRLSRAEVKLHLQKEAGQEGPPPDHALLQHILDNIFQQQDHNNDGFLSSREFTYKHDEL